MIRVMHALSNSSSFRKYEMTDRIFPRYTVNNRDPPSIFFFCNGLNSKSKLICSEILLIPSKFDESIVYINFGCREIIFSILDLFIGPTLDINLLIGSSAADVLMPPQPSLLPQLVPSKYKSRYCGCFVRKSFQSTLTVADTVCGDI